MTGIDTGLEVNSNSGMLVENNPTPGGVRLVNSYRTDRVDSTELVTLAQEIQNADNFTRANVGNKLQMIADQVRFLQEQARKILQEAKENTDLHQVACNFVKKPGQVYYLYCRQSGQKCFSMLSPKEWGASCPHEYLGAFRLELDHSWTPEKNFEEKEMQTKMIDKIISTSNSLTLSITNDSE